MRAAIALLQRRDNREFLRSVARRHGVDPSTLSRRLRTATQAHPYKLPHRPGPPTMLSTEAEQRVLREMRSIQEGGFRSDAITNVRVAQIAYEQSQAARKPLERVPPLRWV